MYTDESDRQRGRSPRQGRPLLFALAAAAILIVLGLVLRAVLQGTEPSTRAVTITPSPEAGAPQQEASKPGAAPSGQATPPVATPLEERQAETPLPALEHSDPEVRSTLSDVLPSVTQPMLGSDDLPRRGATLASNFARGKLPRDKLPFPSPGGKPAIVTRGERIYLAPENFTRYNGLADAAGEFDADAFGRWFDRYEPLLRQAWTELGDGKGDVRGALIAGLDLLLTAPDIEGDIELVQPSVLYRFADPALESLPDTQKLLIRVGPANRAVIKEKARRLRDALARPR